VPSKQKEIVTDDFSDEGFNATGPFPEEESELQKDNVVGDEGIITSDKDESDNQDAIISTPMKTKEEPIVTKSPPPKPSLKKTNKVDESEAVKETKEEKKPIVEKKDSQKGRK